MWEIISNPVTLSVIVMCVLCLCKLNVILSLLVSAMVAGFAAGMGPGEIMGGIITGLNGNGTKRLRHFNSPSPSFMRGIRGFFLSCFPS